MTTKIPLTWYVSPNVSAIPLAFPRSSLHMKQIPCSTSWLLSVLCRNKRRIAIAVAEFQLYLAYEEIECSHILREGTHM